MPQSLKQRHDTDTPVTVLVTGAAGRLGKLLVRRLHRLPGVSVIGMDRRPFEDRPKDVEHFQADLRSKRARNIFRSRKIDALVHVGLLHAPHASAEEHFQWNVRGTKRLLDYCEAHNVGKVVILSSANVYGPRPENAQLLVEEAPLMASQTIPGMRDLVEIDYMASSFFWRAKNTETVILRPVHILGQVKNAASNYLRLNPVPVLMGFDPMLQVIHEEDVCEAIMCSLKSGVSGIYNIVGPGHAPLSAILRLLERGTVPIPHPLAKPLWNLAFRLGFSGFPAEQFDFIRYVCMVDGSRAKKELEFQARIGLEQTLRSVDRLRALV